MLQTTANEVELVVPFGAESLMTEISVDRFDALSSDAPDTFCDGVVDDKGGSSD